MNHLENLWRVQMNSLWQNFSDEMETGEEETKEPLVTTWGNVTLPRARDVGEVASGASSPSAASAAGSAAPAAGYHPHAAAPREGDPSLAPVEPLVTTWGNVTLPRATTGTLPLASSPSLAEELRDLREALL